MLIRPPVDNEPLVVTGASHGNLGPLETFLGYYLNAVGE